ncbi:hypothetical protein AVEN_192656-1 [Araneus ventricosus]|uniref:J domain-containing protein n=1 Tax=Araneus ventricosus TaxID=182803 RepID=A0A4Y2NH05_ARAVE|nr:hypothetical protein AVEN_192656-1 [Araneus ventricosus]
MHRLAWIRHRTDVLGDSFDRNDAAHAQTGSIQEGTPTPHIPKNQVPSFDRCRDRARNVLRMRKQKPLWDAFKSYGCRVESKFFKMDLITVKAALCRLLGVNVDVMPFKDVKILVRKRQLLCHPDKNSQIQPIEIFQDTKVAKCIEFAKEKYS